MTMNSIHMNDLNDLKNIFDKINPPSILKEGEKNDFISQCCEYLYDYCQTHPKLFCNYNYNNILLEVLDDYIQYIIDEINNDIDYEDELEELKFDVMKEFYLIIPKRSKKSNPITFIQNDNYKKYIQQKLEIIYKKDKEQPEQRTQEWFEQRHNLLSASSIWKAIDKQNYKNALIYEKCKPINPSKYNMVNVNSPFHWGQKYEPVAQMYYEHTYDAKIEEFGCIPHTTYHFLGASPDGINVKEDSKRYGRMLEIKNIVNREINGIPKKEYWVQTQLQMECCDLEECDFLECRFKEYENEEAFRHDGSFQYTKEHKYKGIMVQFYHNSKPYYEYSPFHCSEEEFNNWYDKIIHKHPDKTWVSNIYWYLDQASCVLIERNRLWFQSVVHEFEELWNTIEKERIEGYDHRKPVKREKKQKIEKETETKTIFDVLKKQYNNDKEKTNNNGNKPKKTTTKKADNKIIVIDI